MQTVTSVSTKKALFEFIQQKLNRLNWSDQYIDIFEKEITKFCLTISRKWSKVCRNFKKFTKNNREWLNTPFKIPLNKVSTSSSVTGRSNIPYASCSQRTQRRKVKTALTFSNMTSPQIISAAKKKLYVSGQRCAAQLLEEMQLTPNRAKSIKSSFNFSKYPIPYTADEALAFIIDNKLTKQQYISIRLGSKKRNCDIYPSYENIKIAKQNCYPDNMDIGESSCQIPLQNLLDHTAKRICQISDVCEINFSATNLEMLYKWGCDGSSGQSQYRQNFNDDSSITDQSVFMFSIVPLELRYYTVENNYDVIWINPSPSSTKYCRPIKYMFKKETKNSTKEEVNDIEKQIQQLSNTDITIKETVIHIKHTLIFSMVDGKVHTLNTEC